MDYNARKQETVCAIYDRLVRAAGCYRHPDNSRTQHTLIPLLE
jgi:hypothetical protein